MLALHDDDDDVSESESIDPPPPPHPGPGAEAIQEEAYASRCKQISFDLHSEISKFVDRLEKGEAADLDADDARGWMGQLRELNCLLSTYARVATTRVDRMKVEIMVAQSSMASDMLDREACHTLTLESLSKMLAADSASLGTSAPPSANRVLRTTAMISAMQASTTALTTENTSCFFDAPKIDL